MLSHEGRSLSCPGTINVYNYTFLSFALAASHCLLVPPLRHCAAIHHLLCQPFHLRRQVRRVPERGQTHGGSSRQTSAPDSAAAKHQQGTSDATPN